MLRMTMDYSRCCCQFQISMNAYWATMNVHNAV